MQQTADVIYPYQYFTDWREQWKGVGVLDLRRRYKKEKNLLGKIIKCDV